MNIGPELAKLIPISTKPMLEYLQPSQAGSMVLTHTDQHEIASPISGLDSNSSPGIDDIPIVILKASANFFAALLASLINSAMSFGYFPDSLKLPKSFQFIKLVIKQLFQIINRSQSSIVFL